MFLVILLYALFGAVFVIAKVGLEYTQPLFFIGSRMLMASFLLLFYQWKWGNNSFTLTREDRMTLFLLGVFNIYLTNAFEFWGLQYLTSFKTCFIYSMSPFLAALLSYFIFKERLSQKKWAGLIVGVLGFIPILVQHTAQEESVGHFFIFSWAELSVMLAAASTVYGWILMKKLVFRRQVPAIAANGVSMGIGGVMALVNSYLVEDWNPIPVTEMRPFLECTLWTMLLSNIICYNLYGWLLKKFSATFMSFAGYSTPIFTALFGWYFLSEVVSWHFYLSSVIVFFGLILFYQEELQKNHIFKEI